MKRYSIGVDFGSLSGRAVLVDLDTGIEAATSVFEYPHKIMDTELPTGEKLPLDFALQHPRDYLDVLSYVIPDILRKSQIQAEQVIGVGIDFTSCTMLPVLKDGTPLCFLGQYKNRPHSYVKLWKHHAAQKEAEKINEIAEKMGEKWLSRYGGKISSEWFIPKIWQILNEDEVIYNNADRFVEATDWIIWQLTGRETHAACSAGYKAIWHKKDGYPNKKFFKALDTRMENIIGTKISAEIIPMGEKAGEINQFAAELTGLKEGTAVAVGNVDAHVALPAVGIVDSGKMLMIIGTSTCHIVMGDEEREVPGKCGVVEDGVVKGYFGYEAGQSCVGDHFDWFVKNCVPADYRSEGISIHKILREKAKKLKPGESGLLALDFWNGNRSVLVDANLSGMMLGMTLQTKPEEIYRVLIEATAYGTKIIIDTFEENGIPINELYAAGGIAEKDELMMQIYADVTNREIKISGSPQTPALGSAMFGAVAGGYFADLAQCAKVLSKVRDVSYKPIAENVKIYQKIYEEYKTLYYYFGKENNVMKRLKGIKEDVR